MPFVAKDISLKVLPAYTGNMVVVSTEKHCTGRGTHWGGIEPAEPNTPGSQGIEVGSVDIASIATDIGIAQVVCYQEQDIWPGFRAYRFTGPCTRQEDVKQK